MVPNEQAGRTMGMSTRGRTSSNLPPPAASSGRAPASGASSSGTGAASGRGAPLSSKNWTVRPVVKKRDSLPATRIPDHEQDLPALWSTSAWGDVRRGRADPIDGKRFRPAVGANDNARDKDVVARELAAKEAELKKKLAAFASFNQTERDLLKQAFEVVSREMGGVSGLCSRGEFMEVWDRLGTRLTPKIADAFFAKYGEDRTGRMPVDLFVTAALESRNRIIAMEERRVGAYEAGAVRDYAFSGRIKYFPCRKGVYAPSAWDPKLAARSAKPPKEGLSLEWVYGYGGLSNTANNLFYNEDDHAVYYTAAVGIVFDRHVHKQYFFHGHDNDIKCMAMHPDKRIVATGQVGSTTGPPIVCIWDTTVNKKTGQIKGRVAQLPFEGAPAVICLAFSEDGERLVCITNDLDHTVHVFDWATADATLNELAGTRKGAPTELETGVFPGLITVGKGGKGDSFPHVYGVSWNPYGKYDKYDALKNEWSEFVTYGAKHVKLWRLHHSDKNDKIGFYGKDGKQGVGEMGKFSPTLRPTDIMSTAWLPPRGEDQALNGGAILVTGTREGDVLLWNTGKKGLNCVRVLEAHGKGPLIPALSGGDLTLSGVRAMMIRDDGETLVTGGGDGKVLWWATAALTGATRSASFKCIPHTTRSLTGDDNKTPPPIRALDCHKHSSDVMLGTHRCDIWEIDDVNGAHPMAYGHSGDVRALAVHPTEKHIFATGSEAGRLHIWNAKLKMLKAKVNLHHPAVGCGFSPDGKHVAVGCKDGCLLILNYKNIVNGYFKQVVQRADGSRCEFHHCNEAIDEVKYSPDGALLAAGSHDNFIDIYDVTGSAVPGRSNGVLYHRLHRLKGHSSYITHLDWSAYDPKQPDRRVLQSTCGAYELLYYDANTGKQVRHSLRDERWDTQTCTLGFSVMGIWPKSKPGEKAADGTDINACDRGPVPGRDAMGRRNKGELLAVVDDSGRVKLFNYPCVVKHAPFRRMEWHDRPGLARKAVGDCVGYVAHSSHVTNVRFANDGAHVVTVGGFDRAVMQWRVDEDAIEQKGTAKRRPEPRPYVTTEPQPKVTVPRGTGGLTAAEAAALAAELDDDGENQKPEEKCEYLVTVVTGDAKGASTDAAVTFSAAGARTDGATAVIREVPLDNAPDNFQRGNTDVFKLTAADIGTLTHARIGHNGAGDSPGWLLQSVTLTNVTKGWEKTLFPQHVWLDKSRGGETHVTLHASQAEAEKARASLLVDKKYVVSVTTADCKGAGTDANVWIELFGVSGKSSGTRALDNAMNNFERGKTDRFELEIAGLGAGIARARIGHDNAGFGSSWCVAEVHVRTVETGEEIAFDLPHAGVWLEDGSPAGTAVDLFPLGPDGKPTTRTVTYKVEVHTADVKYAGTDANVFVELLGANGSSGRRPLSTSRDNFERGKKDVFFLEMPDLGELSAIKIGHDNAGLGPGWCLDRVIVSDEDAPGEATVFDASVKGKPGGRWLDKSADGGATQCTLAPLAADAGSYYGIETMTSDAMFAGTDANVCITLIGLKDGKETRSKAMKLNDSSNNFERGALEEFEVGPIPDLGELVAIEIGHDGSGIGSGWRCDHVAVWDLTKPDARFHFPVDAWFDKNEPPNKTTQLISVAQLDPDAEFTAYRIDAHTSDVQDAGTNATVSVTIFGERGDTGALTLDTTADNFVRASEDSFTVANARNVGAITHVVLGHDESQLMGDPSWHVAELKVHNLKTGEAVTFPAGFWIGKEREPHFASHVALAPAGKQPVTMRAYKVTVRTSDVRWAGTDAKVSVRLIGAEGKTTSVRVLENDSNNFERNAEDVFVVRDVDVGAVSRVEIKHDGRGVGSDWHLASVEVRVLDADGKDAAKSKSVFFFCDDWVKENAPVTLEAETGGGGRAKYKITVHTSDKRWAGTDASVTARLLGEADGVSSETAFFNLENSANNFERGRVDEFLIDARDVGVVQGIEIKMDNSGLGAAWHLRAVSVAKASAPDDATHFDHDDWLDGKTPSVLLRTSDPGKKATVRYVITTLTSDLRGAGTDAGVSIVLFGEKGETDALLLESSADNFRRGKKDVFNVDAPDVGKIIRVRLGHDNKGSFFGDDASWHCASLEITNTATDETCAFAVNRWFAEDKPPNLTSQVLVPGDAAAAESLCGYKIVAHTSDVRGAGTDANVTLALVGEDEDGNRVAMGPFPLETSADDFKRGAVDTFRAEGPFMKKIVSATVAHDGAGFFGGSDWHLKMLEVTKDASGSGAAPKVTFWCDALVTKDTPMTLTASDGAPKPANDRRRYKVTTRTSADRGSGTDANVFVEIFGERGSTGRRPLDTSADNFARGATDVFVFESPFLGEIQSVKIGHDNSGFGPAWKLDEVLVEDTTADLEAPEWHRSRAFRADAWLDASKAPFATELELTPSDGVFSQRAKVEMTDYTVTVRTSDLPDAGTDASVSIELVGSEGATGWTKLGSSGHTFRKGAADEIQIAGADVGVVERVSLKHDGTGRRGKWHLASLDVRHDGTGAVSKFSCGKWLKNENGVVAETTHEAAAGSGETTTFNYRVDVTTGSRMGAGTDSKVTIGIHCEGMAQAWFPALEQRDDHFESGATDTFVFSRPDELPGKITAVTLTCADAGVFGDSWFCEKVVVSSLAKGTEWVFHCGDWVGKQGTRLEQGILASVSVEDEAKAAEAASKAAGDAGAGADAAAAAAAAAVDGPAEYRVTFWTGGEFGAGTDANVFAELFGANGSSGTLPMDRDASMFDAKCVDAFTRVSPTHLGELAEALVWIESASSSGFMSMVSGDGWNLDKIEVEHVATERSWEAAVDEWIYPGKGKALRAKLAVKKQGLGFEQLAEKAEDAAGDVERLEALRAGKKETGSETFEDQDDAKAPSPRKDPAPVPAPAPAPAPVPAPATPTSLPPVEAPPAETPEERETREFAELEAQAQAEAEAEARLEAEAAAAAPVEAPTEAVEPIEAVVAEQPKASQPKASPLPSLKTPETSSLSLAGGASGSLAGLSKAASISSSSTAHEFELSISRDPVSEPLRVRVLGKGGEGIALVPPNVAFASFTFPAPLDFVTKVYVSYDDEDEDEETARRDKIKTPVSLQRVSLSDPSRGDACAFQLHGCVLDEMHGEARARKEALPGTACEEWEEAVARKDGREKKYWFSQSRNESVWKEPHKYYPVRFAQPE